MLAEDHTHKLLAVYTLRHPGRGDGRVRVLIRPEELEAYALDPLPRGPTKQYVPLEDVLDALVYELLKGDIELNDKAYRGRPRRLRRVLLVGRLRRRPIEVVARHPRLFVHPHGPLTNANEPKARRRHERLLRAGDDYVDSPLVGPQRTGPEARDRIDDGDDVRCGLREALDVVDGARRGLREHADCGFDPRVIRQRVGDLVVVRLLAPFVLQLGNFKSEGPAHLDPPAAEITVVDDKNLVSRRKQVLDRSLESPGPARRVGKDVVLRQEDPLQVLVHPGEHLAELGRTVVNNG